jgi:MYXO-CTERM domain-containing protein
VAAVAVLWELAEFVVDRTAGTNLQVSLPNTMKDLALGLLGAVLLVATRRPTRPGPACV